MLHCSILKKHYKGRFTHSMPCPCRSAKGLECVFPIWFTQCNKATTQHGRLSTAVLCCGLEKNGMVGAWHGHGIANVNQTRPHCVNQMEKTHSKPLAARRGRETAWARHATCESAWTLPRYWPLIWTKSAARTGKGNEQLHIFHVVHFQCSYANYVKFDTILFQDAF